MDSFAKIKKRRNQIIKRFKTQLICFEPNYFDVCCALLVLLFDFLFVASLNLTFLNIEP